MKPNSLLLLVILAASPLAWSPSAALGQEHWPQFRGPNSDGVGHSAQLPDRWSSTENVAWKRDIAGRGWSSPVVWENRLFLTTVINTGTSEEPKKGLYFGGNRPQPPASPHQWMVLCLDLISGELLWERQIHEGLPESPIHLKSSYASETPVTDGKRVYCCFGNLGIFCFDFEGDEVWRRKLKPRATRYGWGTAASPVLHQGRLYYVNDNEEDSYLLALSAATGEEVWRVTRDEKSNWSTPFIWENSERTEIVTPGTGKVRSYDLDGNLLWTLSGMSSITIATPQAHDGLLYLSSGYVMDPLRPIYAIRPGASGDISLTGDATSNEFIAWSQPKSAPYNPTPLVYQDQVFVLLDRGLVSSYDAASGTESYGPKRLPNGRAFTASPWAYNDKIFCVNEDGVTFVLNAGAEFELLYENKLADDDMCMATPAIAGERLIIRTAARVYCFRKTSVGG
ncbi:PQQ-binding-like beta-propeller repeat protein [Planctomycetaceae bacterium SH139]